MIHGTDTVYTDRTSFLANVEAGYFENTFDDVGSGPSDPLTYSEGGFTYTVGTQPGAVSGLFNDVGLISTDQAVDQIYITFDTPVTAVGGNVWATDISVQETGTSVVVALSDGTIETVPTTDATTFRGFTTATPITTMSIDAPDTDPVSGPFFWATLDDLIVGNAAGGGGDTNGVYHSPTLNHAIAATNAGTSLNFVSGAFDDTGPISGDWDQNFWASSNAFQFWSVSTYNNRLVVSGTQIAALHPGDTVGPSSTFQSATGSGTPVPEWRAGTDAYAGFEFNCNGRLEFPVSGVCYGYVHITTTGTTGFPATVVDYSYDGDGNAITIPNGGPTDPVAEITPASLDVTVAAGDSETTPLTVANTGGGTLTWSMTEATAAVPMGDVLYDQYDNQGGNGTSSQDFEAAFDNFDDQAADDFVVPSGATWTITGVDADGLYFNGVGPAPSFNVYFYNDAGGLPGTAVTSQTGLAYTDTGFGQPAITLNSPVVLPAGTYWISIQVRMDFGAGGQWGWEDRTVQAGSPAAFQNPGDGLVTGCTTWAPKLTCITTATGPDMVFRLHGSSGGGGGGCLNPSDVPWLSESPNSGSVAGGDSEDSTVTVDASSLAAGSYSAHICVATNDPANALVDVPVTATVTGGGGTDPAIDVSPDSLSALQPAGQTTTQTLTIANTGGSDLVWTIAEAASGNSLVLHPAPRAMAKGQTQSTTGMSFRSSGVQGHSATIAPWVPNGGILFQADDGSYETAVSLNNQVTQFPAVWINRYSAASAMTINSISIEWPNATTADGDVTGKSINLVAYYDADANGDPSNAVRLGGDTLITIGGPDAFETYPTSFSVPGAGDVYIGFVDAFASGGISPILFSAALDENADPSVGWVSGKTTNEDADLDNLANNDLTGTISDLSGGSLPGAWMIRATGTTGGGGTGCSNPSDIPWLSESPTGGTTAAGASTPVTVTFNSTGLADGTYTAELCVNSNDPVNATVEVPVTLTVQNVGPGTFPPDENFDEVVAPALPGGWSTQASLNGVPWVTTTDFADSAPNAAFAPDIAGDDTDGADMTMDSPSFTPVEGQTLTFRHKFNLESTFDGGVVEISVAGGAFQDIIAAGGHFETGGYTGPISTSFNSPIAGRNAWSGDSGGFITTVIDLPAASVGQSTVLRFRTATDLSVGLDPPSGWWVDSIHLGLSIPPVADITPTSLTFTDVPADGTATDTLNIANVAAAGGQALTFSISARGTGARPVLKPHVLATARNSRVVANGKPAQQRLPTPFRFTGSGVMTESPRIAPWAPVGPDGSVTFQADDGGYETAVSLNNQVTQFPAVWINRYSASAALTIDSISIEWPNATTADGDVTGKSINLVAYYDADANGDPSNAVRLGGDTLITIGGPDAFETYPTSFAVPGAGDVYIGFVDAFASGGISPILFSAALDENADPSVGWVSGKTTNEDADLDNLANNDLTGTISDLSGGSLPGAWMIRATGTGGGSGPCSGPVVPWLTASPSTGSVNAGSSQAVTVTVNPAAGGLGEGSYTANLCITTNDPDHAQVVVPVSVTVTPGTPNDGIFCSGFENGEDGSCGGGPVTPGVYTDRDSFLAHVAAGYFENPFDDVQSGASDPLTYSEGGFTYTIGTQPGAASGLFNDVGLISTDQAADQIFITFTTPVTAVGGNVWATDISVQETGTSIVVVLSDGTTETVATTDATTFRGFVTAAPITTMSIDAPDDDPVSGPFFWSTLDNLIVGNAQ